MDVTLIRIGFVLAAIVTKGAAMLGYVVMMFIVPEAKTPEERAAAGGAPFNAKEVIDRAKKQYAEGTRHWRRHWRQQQRHWRRYGRRARRSRTVRTPGAPRAPACLRARAPRAVRDDDGDDDFAREHRQDSELASAGGHPGLGRRTDPAGRLSGRRLSHSRRQLVVAAFAGRRAGAWFAFWNAVVWMVGLAVVVWIASDHVPEIREFLQRLPDVVRQFVSMRFAMSSRGDASRGSRLGSRSKSLNGSARSIAKRAKAGLPRRRIAEPAKAGLPRRRSRKRRRRACPP